MPLKFFLNNQYEPMCVTLDRALLGNWIKEKVDVQGIKSTNQSTFEVI